MISRLSKGALLGVAAGIAGVVASITPFGLRLGENLGLEILFRLRGERKPPPEVLLVSIDKESADRLDLPDDLRKWPRSLHARLTETLANQGASVIVFDIFFEDPSKPEDDLAFASAIRKANNVLLCCRLLYENVPLTGKEGTAGESVQFTRRISPQPLLSQAAVASPPYPIPKMPVTVSRDLTFRTTAGDTPTLPVVAYQLFTLPVYDDFLHLMETALPECARKLPRSGEEIRRSRNVEDMVRDIREIFEKEPAAEARMLAALDGANTLSADPDRYRTLRSLIHLYGGGNSKFLNFYGPVRTIPTVPYYKVLEPARKEDGYPPPWTARGKAVFIGWAASHRLSQKDGFHTVFTRKDGVDLSGVEIAATSFANLAEDRPLRPLPFRLHVIILILWGLAIGIFSYIFRPGASVPAVAGLSLLYLGAAEYRFAASGEWYPVVFPLLFQVPFALLGSVAWKYVDLTREKRNFRKAFGYYLPIEVVDELAENMTGLKVREQLVNGICLATDAEQYTSLAESMDPKQLVGFMNRYYETVFDPVKRHGGMVSNVIGDSMLALWLTAKGTPDSLNHACLAALEIADAMREFRRSHDGIKLPTRIGLHSGEILLGSIGAGDHFEYRPVGDIVNTATRIEGANKHLGTRILASQEVLSGVDGFLTRDLGKFLLAGKSRTIHIHELVNRMEAATPRQREYCAVFTEGMESFRRQSWERASNCFHETLKIREIDGPSLFYLRLCARYALNPPGDSWDGVIHVESK
jgi:adenylate cyclase